jgi:SAM-dependent methyltransferase
VKLNLGCGARTLFGYHNVDKVVVGPGVDEVVDLDYPWPWSDATVEEIRARDLFEHVADPVLFMREAHRVLVPGGLLWIRCPNIALNLADAFTDPTHRRFPTWHTFDFWIPGTPYHAEHNAAYGGVSFGLHDARPDDGSMVVELVKPDDGSGLP